jgi:GNAT superfamily N-acetyltransferase
VVEIERVSKDEADAASDLLARAFYDDPVWSWAFPDPAKRLEHHRALWGLIVHSAIAYGWVWRTADRGAVAVWIPPGQPELSLEDQAQLEALLSDLLGPRSEAVLGLFERLEENHPQSEPHYYLSLLGTHPDHRGKGKGMSLLAATLERIDSEGMPAYLESSNRTNDERYRRVGFELVGELSAPDGGPTVGCMWRPGQPAG